MSDCPKRFELVAWKLGKVDPPRAEQLREHVAGCSICHETIGKLERNMGEYDSHHATRHSELMEKFERLERSEASAAKVLPFAKVASITAAIAASIAIAFVFFGQSDPPAIEGSTPPQFGVKGAISCDVFAKRGAEQFRVSSGAKLRENDALRFVVTTGAKGFLAVGSIDSKGEIQSLYPETDPDTAPEPMELPVAGRHALPGSIVLDGAQGREAYIVVFSEKYFARDKMYKKLENIAYQAGKMSPVELKRRLKENRLELEILEIEKVSNGKN